MTVLLAVIVIVSLLSLAAVLNSRQMGLKVYLTEPALEGKANKRLVDVLAGYFNVKKYNIKIVKGNKQREKVIEVSAAD